MAEAVIRSAVLHIGHENEGEKLVVFLFVENVVPLTNTNGRPVQVVICILIGGQGTYTHTPKTNLLMIALQIH